MTTNRQKIAEWRKAHPVTRLDSQRLLDILGLDTLRGADLRGANLYGADLLRADLRWADLRWADLSKADLQGADLSEANLYKADLRGAKNIVTFGPIGSRGDFTYAVRHTDCIMVKCGCFWGDFEHWQAKCRAIHKDTPHGRAYAAAAEFIRAYAAAYWQD